MAEQSVSHSGAWKALQSHAGEMESVHLRDLFTAAQRFEDFSVELKNKR